MSKINDFATEKKIVPIDDVIPNPWNDNFQDSFTFDRQKKSIENFGMLGSIITYSHAGHYRILGGEHRWKAMKEAGYTECPIENIEKPLTDSEAKALVMLLNMQGKKDVMKTAEMLQEMEEGQLGLLPMTDEEIENTKKFISFDFSQFEPIGEEKERKFGMVVVMPMTSEESAVWNHAKNTMVERGWIDKDNSKKRQDIQMVMRLIKGFLGVTEGATGDQTVFEIEA